MSTPAPYPPNTRANGCRFEFDFEELNLSDTWFLAAEIPLAQHALVLMRLVAWAQIPCGSLPSNEAVIRTKCNIPADDWPRLRDVLLRGWWQAADGRLYHDDLVNRVQEMLVRLAKETRRNQAWRAGASTAKQVQRVANARSARLLTVSKGAEGSAEIAATPTSRAAAVKLAARAAPMNRIVPSQVTFAMRKDAGLADTIPSDPKLLALIKAGATVDQFVEAAKRAVAEGRGFVHALTIVEGQCKDAAVLAGQLQNGASSTQLVGQPIERPRNILEVAPLHVPDIDGLPDPEKT